MDEQGLPTVPVWGLAALGTRAEGCGISGEMGDDEYWMVELFDREDCGFREVSSIGRLF